MRVYKKNISCLLSLVRSWGLVRGRALTVTSYHLAGYMLHQVLRDLHLRLGVLRLLHGQ